MCLNTTSLEQTYEYRERKNPIIAYKTVHCIKGKKRGTENYYKPHKEYHYKNTIEDNWKDPFILGYLLAIHCCLTLEDAKKWASPGERILKVEIRPKDVAMIGTKYTVLTWDETKRRPINVIIAARIKTLNYVK